MTSPNAAIVRAGQSLTPGDRVALYQIDLNPLGVNTIFAFTAEADRARGPLVFRGVTYQPFDIKCSGFDLTSSGKLPRPTVAITNVKRVMSSAAILYDDLIGGRFTRLRTYAQFLDNGPSPDPEAAYAPDIYYFDQKTGHGKRTISWELSSSIDFDDRKLPARVMIRDVCPYVYRRLKPDGTWDFSQAECPYEGAQAYDRDGVPTTPDKDVPGRRVDNCCKVRFGATAALPFGGFPGLGRVRV